MCQQLQPCIDAGATARHGGQQSHLQPGLLVSILSYLKIPIISIKFNLCPFLCSSFREYVACSESVVMKKCGMETALFTRSFMHQMTVPMIKEYCDSSNQEHECDYKNAGALFGQTPFIVPCGILIWLVMLVKMVLLY